MTVITIDVPVFNRQVLGAIVRRLNHALSSGKRAIEQGIGAVIEQAVKVSPEYGSILAGDLWHQLGIVDPAGTLSAIVTTLKKDVFVTLFPLTVAGDKIQGGLQIGILRADYASILSLPSARFISEGAFVVDWLAWLLGSGTNLVVQAYHFSNYATPQSRTGVGLMSKGGNWYVPSIYAGTYDSNWLTRALATIEEDVSLVLQREIQKRL